MICAQARVPGISVSQVARRYNVNANLVFKWRKDPRYVAAEVAVDDARFLPIEIVDDARPSGPSPSTADGLIELDLAGGHRVRISGRYDPEALARLLRGLMG